MYFITIHDKTGKRIDDDSDYPMSERELTDYLSTCVKLKINGEVFYDDDGQIISYQGLAS